MNKQSLTLRPNHNFGFTMIELVVDIVVLGILASVAVPKFMNLTDHAKQSVCDANVGAINSALANHYSLQSTSLNPGYPERLTGGMFAEGHIPECPYGWEYDYTQDAGRVSFHVHLESL